jgi:hypothetical protein
MPEGGEASKPSPPYDSRLLVGRQRIGKPIKIRLMLASFRLHGEQRPA